MGVSFLNKCQQLVISKSLTNQNKVAVAEEIKCGNDIALRKFFWRNKLRINKIVMIYVVKK